MMKLGVKEISNIKINLIYSLSWLCCGVIMILRKFKRIDLL